MKHDTHAHWLSVLLNADEDRMRAEMHEQIWGGEHDG